MDNTLSMSALRRQLQARRIVDQNIHQPVHFDGSVLQVGARNGYARDWLSKNILQQAGLLLSKALSATVGLEFVSVETVEA